MTSPRRIRGGVMEWYCELAGVWYRNVVTHIHRHHRAKCKCLRFCANTTKTGQVMLRPAVARARAR